MENKTTFYIYPDSENWWFPNTKNTFFDSKMKNVKIGNTKIPIIIGTKTFNLKELMSNLIEILFFQYVNFYWYFCMFFTSW